jgi:ABC-type transporter Mla MlaB component
VELVSADALHHRVVGAPTLNNARRARSLFDAVFNDLGRQDESQGPTVDVSLGGVTDGNSVLVSLMLVWLRRARDAGLDIRFLDIPPLVLNLIEFTGLDQVLPITSEDAA